MTGIRAGTAVLLAALLVAGGCAVTPQRTATPQPDADSTAEPSDDAFQTEASQTTDAILGGPRSWPSLEPVESASGDLWDRLRAGFMLPGRDNPRAQEFARWYAGQPEHLSRVTERASLYLRLVVEATEKRGLPSEVALLPVIESGYWPLAYSPSHAAGLWQFIPSTARAYGLEANDWYDARRDIIASTRAALNYLTKLRDDFGGDWLLALAAYNCGEGTVGRAVEQNRRRGKPTDFWSLELPPVTQEYVPKLLGIAALVDDPERYRVTLPAIPDDPMLTVVEVRHQVDLAQVADLAEVSLKEMLAMNPGFKRTVTAPGGPHRLLVPAERAESLKDRLLSLRRPAPVPWRTHSVVAGETLSGIARRYGTNVEALRRRNRLGSDRLAVGDELVVPNSGAPSERPKSRATIAARQPKGEHRVRRGETLWGIARRHHVSVAQLKAWNPRVGNRPLQPGQRLALSGAEMLASVAPMRDNTVEYTVRSGDSLWAIAGRFNVSVEQLARWNGLKSGSVLPVGHTLRIQVGADGPQGS